jgi:RNA polymerase sigma factor (sigma-70 family)
MTSLLTRTPPADRQFERLYRKHVGDVYRYALVVLRNPADAEDVTQTTFLNAYRAMCGGERPQAAKNWLIAIAHNVCRQRFRQAQRRPQEVVLFEDAAELAVEEDEDGYSAEDIQRALGFLAFNQRAALVMRELEGRSYAEIAEIMRLSVSAVETLIFRARRALREQLEGGLTCGEAERLLSKQTDGMLSRSERGQLRAHLRECDECATMARSQRASRGALKALFGGIPVPASLTSLFGGGGTILATKAAAVVFAGAVVGGAGYAGVAHHHHPVKHESRPSQTTQVRESRASTPRSSHVSRAAAARPSRAVAHGFVVPKGAKHLKVVEHVRIARGFVVPPGQHHLHVVTHLRLVPKAQPRRRTHPAHPAHPVHPVQPPHPARETVARPSQPAANSARKFSQPAESQ